MCSTFIPNQGMGGYSKFVQNSPSIRPCTTFVYRKHASTVESSLQCPRRCVCTTASVDLLAYTYGPVEINRSHGTNCGVGIIGTNYPFARLWRRNGVWAFTPSFMVVCTGRTNPQICNISYFHSSMYTVPCTVCTAWCGTIMRWWRACHVTGNLVRVDSSVVNHSYFKNPDMKPLNFKRSPFVPCHTYHSVRSS